MTGIPQQRMTNSEGMRLFTPSFQSLFWQSLDPNMSLFLDLWEERESWTWKYQDLPEFFIQLSELLPELAKVPVYQVHAESINSLIQLLSTMPLRYAISAVSWLDAQQNAETTLPGLSWGMLCYQEAARITTSEPESEIFAWAKVFLARISVMARTQIATELFSQEIIKRNPRS